MYVRLEDRLIELRDAVMLRITDTVARLSNVTYEGVNKLTSGYVIWCSPKPSQGNVDARDPFPVVHFYSKEIADRALDIITDRLLRYWRSGTSQPGPETLLADLRPLQREDEEKHAATPVEGRSRAISLSLDALPANQAQPQPRTGTEPSDEDPLWCPRDLSRAQTIQHARSHLFELGDWWRVNHQHPLFNPPTSTTRTDNINAWLGAMQEEIANNNHEEYVLLPVVIINDSMSWRIGMPGVVPSAWAYATHSRMALPAAGFGNQQFREPGELEFAKDYITMLNAARRYRRQEPEQFIDPVLRDARSGFTGVYPAAVPAQVLEDHVAADVAAIQAAQSIFNRRGVVTGRSSSEQPNETNVSRQSTMTPREYREQQAAARPIAGIQRRRRPADPLMDPTGIREADEPTNPLAGRPYDQEPNGAYYDPGDENQH